MEHPQPSISEQLIPIPKGMDPSAHPKYDPSIPGLLVPYILTPIIEVMTPKETEEQTEKWKKSREGISTFSLVFEKMTFRRTRAMGLSPILMSLECILM